MKFRDALIEAVRQARDAGELTPAEAVKIRVRSLSPAFCSRCEELAVTEGVASGTIPYSAEPGARDWSAFLEFLKGLMPLIMELIKLFS